MKAIIRASTSSDAGKYNAMLNVQYDQEVECTWSSEKHIGISIPYHEMLRIGGDPTTFNEHAHQNAQYLWGDFDVVEVVDYANQQ